MGMGAIDPVGNIYLSIERCLSGPELGSKDNQLVSRLRSWLFLRVIVMTMTGQNSFLRLGLNNNNIVKLGQNEQQIDHHFYIYVHHLSVFQGTCLLRFRSLAKNIFGHVFDDGSL